MTRFIPQRSAGDSPLAVMNQSKQLGFPIRVLGRSTAPIIPQRIGPWWMEPLLPTTSIPRRARQRLDALLAVGVQPKAIVLFHEIPKSTPSLPQTHPVREQLIDAAARAAELGRRNAPVARRLALDAVKFTASTLSALSTRLAQMKKDTANVLDPCLVIVTEDGTFIEVDRWYS